MLDENLDPFLIEVNHAPSFATESNLDLKLKRKLLQDTFRLLNMSVKKKLRYKKERNKIIQNRVQSKTKELVNLEEKELIRRLLNYERHKFEMNNLGEYELLYPLTDDKFNLIGDHSKDYYISKLDVNLISQRGYRSSKFENIDSSKNNFKSISSVSDKDLIRQDPSS